MDYRILESNESLEQVVDVEIAVWGLHPRDGVPSSMMRAVIHAGGVVLGAYDGDVLVGFALGLPALREGRLILWSHSTGVLPAYQGRDIGFTLKQKQRAWALEHGYDEIGWTFDPFRRGNANFNLHRLGAVSNLYHVNFYGDMPDTLNKGTPTDRLEAVWRLYDSRVVSLANGVTPELEYPPVTHANILVTDGSFYREALASKPPILFAEIPVSFEAPSATQTWRAALNQGLQDAFAQGYSATDVTVADGRTWYVLKLL